MTKNKMKKVLLLGSMSLGLLTTLSLTCNAYSSVASNGIETYINNLGVSNNNRYYKMQMATPHYLEYYGFNVNVYTDFSTDNNFGSVPAKISFMVLDQNFNTLNDLIDNWNVTFSITNTLEWSSNSFWSCAYFSENTLTSSYIYIQCEGVEYGVHDDNDIYVSPSEINSFVPFEINYLSQGYIEGYDSGYAQGVASIDTQSIYNNGYQEGISSVDTQSIYNNGRANGYQLGYVDGQSSTEFSFQEMFWSIADVPAIVLSSLFSVELFGIEFYKVFGSLLTLVVVLYLIKKII